MSDEARVHPRLRLNVSADVIGDEVMLAHPLDDISLGGCRFAAMAWEAEGRELQLVLDFPASGASIPVGGVVVRASERDMGVRFHDITDEQKWALRKHLRETQSS
ncbi:PilZ domain-containing protein [Enhygromyxa salina]|uniref:PilZ domain protein n=1 Tax=Enhygromyxa salina TaxID=215803 RepID=A0A2S9YPV5_9BACT|nr:PilZ domain-containing protein [Enhygromyxa salina]PRQ07108.1 PilZ domain protein [Enhygromyxa salina]